MKKLILTTLAASVLAFNVQADIINFDPAGDGTTSHNIDELTLSAFETFEIKQYFHGGANDNQLDAGDIFTESFTYTATAATLTGSGIQQAWHPSFTTEQVTFTLNLSGIISDVIYGAGVPTLNTSTFADDFAQTSFKTVFSNSSSVPGTGMTAMYDDGTGPIVIGEFDILQGESTLPVALDGSTVGFALKFDFNDAWRSANTALFDSVWSHSNGTPFTSANDFNFALAQASAGPTGNAKNINNDPGPLNGTPLFVQDDGGVNNGRIYASVEVDDNGADIGFQVPEPTTLAILGLGLLGFAGTRRRS